MSVSHLRTKFALAHSRLSALDKLGTGCLPASEVSAVCQRAGVRCPRTLAGPTAVPYNQYLEQRWAELSGKGPPSRGVASFTKASKPPAKARPRHHAVPEQECPDPGPPVLSPAMAAALAAKALRQHGFRGGGGHLQTTAQGAAAVVAASAQRPWDAGAEATARALGAATARASARNEAAATARSSARNAEATATARSTARNAAADGPGEVAQLRAENDALRQLVLDVDADRAAAAAAAAEPMAAKPLLAASASARSLSSSRRHDKTRLGLDYHLDTARQQRMRHSALSTERRQLESEVAQINARLAAKEGRAMLGGRRNASGISLRGSGMTVNETARDTEAARQKYARRHFESSCDPMTQRQGGICPRSSRDEGHGFENSLSKAHAGKSAASAQMGGLLSDATAFSELSWKQGRGVPGGGGLVSLVGPPKVKPGGVAALLLQEVQDRRR